MPSYMLAPLRTPTLMAPRILPGPVICHRVCLDIPHDCQNCNGCLDRIRLNQPREARIYERTQDASHFYAQCRVARRAIEQPRHQDASNCHTSANADRP